MPFTSVGPKTVVAMIFSKEFWSSEESVLAHLDNNDCKAENILLEETDCSFHVSLTDEEIGAYNPESLERVDEDEPGITKIIGLKFDEKSFKRLSFKRTVEIKFDSAKSKDDDSKADDKAAILDWFPILYTGDFVKYDFEFSIMPETLSMMINNFTGNILKKPKLPIDYSHANYQKAAGWITELKVGDDGRTLYAKAQWTPAGEQALLEREFAYFSAEFSLNYQEEGGAAYGAVLHGGALTNIPFLKLDPIIPMSHTRESLNTIIFQEEKNMGEQITLSSVQADLNAKTKEIETLKAENVKLAGLAQKVETLSTQLSSAVEENKKLQDTMKAAEKTQQFQKLLSEGKAVEAQREAWLANDMVTFAEKAVKTNISTQTTTGNVEGSGKVELSQSEKDLIEKYLAPMGITAEDYKAANNLQ